ncbi:EAL domain-containing protein [Pseudoalteromonas luteoviolacea]|uniref:EAL domain-containing protein n=1 Tax=Pseudoalteromonas luteoviolacea TaxID=43657 RepID=UPI001B361829|nr:EAL domain-containing protein [Pseudoalteromonas luteoviolacea]MBQ4839488.1 EAL domain-containing protein [Pseudoalteromonas luteoviolacea]
MDKAYSINLKVWLTLLSTISAAVFASVLIVFSYQIKKDFIIEQTVHASTQITANIANTATSTTSSGFFTTGDPRVLVNSLRSVAVIDKQLIVRDSTDKRQIGLSANTLFPQLAQVVHQQKTKAPRYFFDSQTNMLVTYQALSAPQQNTGNADSDHLYFIYSQFDLTETFSLLLTHYNHNAWFIIFAIVFISVLALLVTYYFIHRPISELTQISNKLSDFEFIAEHQIKGDGELKHLANNLARAAHTLDIGFKRQKLAEQNALDRHSVLQGIFSALPDIFFIIDKQSKILECHYGRDDNLPVPEKQFVGQQLVDILPSHAAKHFAKAISTIEQSSQLTQIEYKLDNTGSTKHFEARLNAIPQSDKLVIAVRDITDKKRQEEVILKHAFYDTLTNLPNRFLALDRLQQMIHEAKRNQQLIAVGFIDLDDFKKVNDSMGHEVGDKVLVHSASVLKGALRKHDTVARLGGDEFIILLGDIQTHHDITAIATKLVQLFRSPFEIDERAFTISLSLGVAVFPDDADSPNELLRKADSAMYSAKHMGRNTFSFFTESMSQDLNRRLKLEDSMRSALANQEFEVYFQPQYDLSSRFVVGAEALLRWYNAELGWVSPAEFIPLAEQTGYIIELGEFVLDQAMQQICELRDFHPQPYRIAVNLSPRQFKDPNLVNSISRMINKYQIDTQLLELEITEGVLLTGDALVKDALFEFHQLGVLVSMDDFGTGYSSLNYLRLYPFDVVKIDQSFIFDMHTSEQVRQLVHTIITMAHNLGIKVIAEGIETQLQLDVLAALGCDLGQGYFLGKPMAKIDFEAWLAQYAHQPLNIENKSLSIQDY